MFNTNEIIHILDKELEMKTEKNQADKISERKRKHREAGLRYYYRHKEELKKRRKTYNIDENKTRIRSRKYYEKNKEKIAEKSRKYYQNNVHEKRAYQRKYYRNHRKKILAYLKRWRQSKNEGT